MYTNPCHENLHFLSLSHDDDDDNEIDDEEDDTGGDDIYIMMQFLSVTKNHHFSLPS